jgi:hypothetical protein
MTHYSVDMLVATPRGISRDGGAESKRSCWRAQELVDEQVDDQGTNVNTWSGGGHLQLKKILGEALRRHVGGPVETYMSDLASAGSSSGWQRWYRIAQCVEGAWCALSKLNIPWTRADRH